MIFADWELSQKLERTEARANADFVETRGRLNPEHGAEWIEVGGAYAMFDGAESPLTQTFCLGMFEETTDQHLDEIEAFFIKHEAPVFHEVSPLTDTSLMTLLNKRGYQPVEHSSVLYRLLDVDTEAGTVAKGDLSTRVITPNETDLWAATSAAGWATVHPDLGEFMLKFCEIGAQCEGAFPYICEINGKPISTGALLIYDDICILAGASTIPEGRNRGAQNALLGARLEYAAENGCTLAMMGASPGSQSQRNAEKNDFRIAYTRTKWQLVK